MGLGGGTGAGLDPFVTNKQVVFLGDSTFFHSGIVAISDSIKSGQDITYIILDNKTTAMTGHQPTPGTELNLMGDATFAQNIEKIIEGMARGKLPEGQSAVPVVRVDPSYRDSYRALLEETILKDGVKVIIADKECGITYHRRIRKEKKTLLRRKGYLPEEKHVNITPEVCEFCLECTRNTGCPGLTIEDTLYGPKIVTDTSHCVADGACAKAKVCPSFEEVVVRRRAPSRLTPVLPPAIGLPKPPAVVFEECWNIYTAAVGGMGAGVLSAILVQAAQKQGYRVLFSDKKGLAIRNGGVYGHIIFCKAGGTFSPLVPYGKADVILGIDLLEATRGLDPQGNLRIAHPERTRAVVNTAQNPTILMLMGQDAPAGPRCEELLRRQVRPDGYFGVDF
jgi:indolepyruvate ferredoxin oxidoreductase